MLVVRGHTDVPETARGAALAIGNFDGVHRGHQALLAQANAHGRRLGRLSGVIVFEPHPRVYFQPHVPMFQLSPLAQKLDLLARHGAEVAIVLAFDQALADLTADAFIADVLVAGLGAGHVIAGYDFQFGKGRRGTTASLEAASRGGAFGVTIVPPVNADAVVASSSAARAALTDGAVEQAAAILGRWWRVDGVVTGGAGRGSGMGYPTANITLDPGLTLAHGIYAARVHVDGEVHAAAAYLGTRPTFDNGRPVLETFLLDFDGNLYGKTIAVEFISRLRGDRAFNDMAALIAQMDLDVDQCRARLARLSNAEDF